MKSVPGAFVLVVGSLLPIISCSTSPPPPVEVDSASLSPDAGGMIEGRVLFEGTMIPESTQVENTTDPEACGRFQSLGDIIVSRENRGVRHAIVRLNGVALPEDYRPAPSRLVLDNRDCEFQPHVAVLTTGSSVEAVNSDPVSHSVHFYGGRSTNLALGPNQSKQLHATLTRPGLYVIKCDIHGWMQAFVRVDPHPFHATSGADGRFQIQNIPPGSYTLETWHEYFGTSEIHVDIRVNRASPVTVYLSKPIIPKPQEEQLK